MSDKSEVRETANDIRAIAVKIQPQFIYECSQLYDLVNKLERLFAEQGEQLEKLAAALRGEEEK